MLRLAERLDEWTLSAVVVCEGGDTRLAETVAVEAGREIRTVTLHSMQSVSAAEISSGVGYLDIMENDLTALLLALAG